MIIRPKNRKDGSDFDDFLDRLNRNGTIDLFLKKKSDIRNERKVFEKFFAVVVVVVFVGRFR